MVLICSQKVSAGQKKISWYAREYVCLKLYGNKSIFLHICVDTDNIL